MYRGSERENYVFIYKCFEKEYEPLIYCGFEQKINSLFIVGSNRKTNLWHHRQTVRLSMIISIKIFLGHSPTHFSGQSEAAAEDRAREVAY